MIYKSEVSALILDVKDIVVKREVELNFIKDPGITIFDLVELCLMPPFLDTKDQYSVDIIEYYIYNRMHTDDVLKQSKICNLVFLISDDISMKYNYLKDMNKIDADDFYFKKWINIKLNLVLLEKYEFTKSTKINNIYNRSKKHY